MSKSGKRGLSPQEKKRLSYERDCVNVYGANDKASRKNIPKMKARSNRKLRRKAAILINGVAEVMEGYDDIDPALSDATFEGLHPMMHGLKTSTNRKDRDLPIGVTLDDRSLRRFGDADRKPTRNVRESLRAAIEIDSCRSEPERHRRKLRRDNGQDG